MPVLDSFGYISWDPAQACLALQMPQPQLPLRIRSLNQCSLIHYNQEAIKHISANVV